MAATAEDWVRVLGLSEHPEGGYYREVYRSADVLSAEQLPQRYGAPRSLETSIYYLLRAGDRSRIHRLRSDEIWHYHARVGHAAHAQGGWAIRAMRGRVRRVGR